MAELIINCLSSLSDLEWKSRPPAKIPDIEEFEQAHGLVIPDDHKKLLLFSDGGGIFEHQSTISFFSVEELKASADEAELEEYLPGMYMIGTDRGDSLYYYDPQNRLGYGAYAIFLVSAAEATVEDSIFIGHSIMEVIEAIIANEDFSDRPYLDVQ